MTDEQENLVQESPVNLAIDPDVLASELAAELLGDPLDEIDFEGFDPDSLQIAMECESGLTWLKEGHEQRLQGLRVFCEHRDPRALPLLIPLLKEPCPVERMSAVYALGRNPCPRALDLLLNLLKNDCNAYVRKATAWSLGNYPDDLVLQPLINALKNDVSAVRLWASSSLADVVGTSSEKAAKASEQLLISLKIDSEPVVRSNCIWALGRIIENLEESLRTALIDAFFDVLLNDVESSVRDEARIVLEQLGTGIVRTRLQELIDDGVLV
ncbi:HEAT repeat domain-containing protein [Prochlorococcus sp. MIT 1341]|uniref:HEAT repeat domain-containing protein n=1 Tax=Prochlorococcus sp. MIT 1341 TaxID=3096221 RepID=UPI002A75C79E|nr:HEAT repeat domain-containing protein [Prochlorococcus sp. MIT 1341]